MSKSALGGPAQERTARVWQPADYLSSVPVGQAFQTSPWMEPRRAGFSMTRLEPPLSEELSEATEETAALGYEAALVDPEPALLAPVPEAAVHSSLELEQVRAQALEEGRQQALREAAEEVEKARAQAQAWQEALAARLAALEQGVRELSESPERLYEPLKRLALHMAEQLVLGELTLAPQAIERLARRCVDELDLPRGTPVRLEVHPDDLAPLRDLLAQRAGEAGDSAAKAAPWTVQANATLLPGSVRASANDAMVSDLIEHRIEAIARQLLQVPAQAREQSAFKPERLAARRAEVSQVIDAQPRRAEPGRGDRFAPVIEADAAFPRSEPAADFDAPGDGPAGDETP